MHQKLQQLFDSIRDSPLLSDDEKNALTKKVKEADKELAIIAFKLDRTEKVKRTTTILLEETIEELEQKRKAVEVQNHELAIESSLERVRTVALSMRKPDDMLQVCRIISEQLELLRIKEIRNVQTAIFYEDKGTYMNYEYYAKHNKTIITETAFGNNEIHKSFADKMLKGYGEFMVVHIQGEEVKDWIAYQKTTNVFIDDYLYTAASLNYYWYSLGAVALGISTYEPLTDEQINLFKRFLKVFELSYRRYLDIENAEAQAKAATIEAALERTRTQSMIMQQSKELDDTLRVFHEQVLRLGIRSAFSFLWLPDEEKEQHIFWAAWAEQEVVANMKTTGRLTVKSKAINYPLDRNEPATAQCLIDWKGNEPVVAYHVPPAGVESYFAAWNELLTGVEELKPEAFKGGLYYVEAFMKYGCFGIMASVDLTADEKKILGRFAIEFERTYRRFLDLQKAEAQARESQIEAALERVRSRTLAMQKSNELAETAAVLFRQLIGLGIEPNRLYITIIKDQTGDMEFWITDEDGTRVSSKFSGNAFRNASFEKMYRGWHTQKKSIIIDMQGEELANYFNHLGELHVPFKTGLTQMRRVQHIAYFGNGFIGMASPEEQPEAVVTLLERFAAVFNLTYTRFNDLQLAEAHAVQAEEDLIKLQIEKRRAEDALIELRETQKQLIQSEKMASLGELTAGIAHEIQNPLNFVNNFSEVSNELMDEMLEEVRKGNYEEVQAIATDVRQNLEKINHHGQRAAGIVKGMLQHSRNSGLVKEPTDINKLADEYLRLAYHGLRAKDKSFNAGLKTDYDETIGLVNIIPQDIGRAILNLLTNAFYAVAEKKKQLPDYEPVVSISTKRCAAGEIQIQVTDNGNGIPQKIVDKIFQPFFTTKPTGQGTGLGLSLAYDIVKAHGGELKVKTQQDAGTTFTIILSVLPAN